MKKVCILRGSPRKTGNSNSLVTVVAEELTRQGHTVTDFDLCTMDVRPCIACRWCQKDWTQASCIQKDDMQPIFDAILDCDLILLATPIYSWFCTPPMKAALDRLVYVMNMFYGPEKGPALWAGKSLAMVVSCGYRPDRGADLWEEAMRRYCKHSELCYAGMLCERHKAYHLPFLTEEVEQRALDFTARLLDGLSVI